MLTYILKYRQIVKKHTYMTYLPMKALATSIAVEYFAVFMACRVPQQVVQPCKALSALVASRISFK